ncbi:peroxidase 5-like protein [Tanacetum coccineum]
MLTLCTHNPHITCYDSHFDKFLTLRQVWSFELVLFTPGTTRNMIDFANIRKWRCRRCTCVMGVMVVLDCSDVQQIFVVIKTASVKSSRYNFSDARISDSGYHIVIISKIDELRKAESEQDHGVYARTLKGLDIIDQAKAMLEAACPNTVSCANILAFAARDSTNSVDGFSYAIPSGQQDGRISRIGKDPKERFARNAM